MVVWVEGGDEVCVVIEMVILVQQVISMVDGDMQLMGGVVGWDVEFLCQVLVDNFGEIVVEVDCEWFLQCVIVVMQCLQLGMQVCECWFELVVDGGVVGVRVFWMYCGCFNYVGCFIWLVWFIV